MDRPLPPGFRVVTRLGEDGFSFADALALVRLTDWHAGIPEEVFRIAVTHSASFGVLSESPVDGRALVAYARVVTDRATYAYLCDVVVHPAARGRGLSHALVRATLADPAIGSLRRYSLLTRHAAGLYRKHGFVDGDPAVTYLEVHRPMYGRASLGAEPGPRRQRAEAR